LRREPIVLFTTRFFQLRFATQPSLRRFAGGFLLYDIRRSLEHHCCPPCPTGGRGQYYCFSLSPQLSATITDVALYPCNVSLKGEGTEPFWRQTLRKRGEKGIIQSQAQWQASVLLKQLQIRFGGVDSQYRQRIKKADADTLFLWAERILTADSIGDVFI